MPAYDVKTLPDKDLKDLIAFLLAASEKGGASEEPSEEPGDRREISRLPRADLSQEREGRRTVGLLRSK